MATSNGAHIFTLGKHIEVHLGHGDAKNIWIDRSDKKIQHNLLFRCQHIFDPVDFETVEGFVTHNEKANSSQNDEYEDDETEEEPSETGEGG